MSDSPTPETDSVTRSSDETPWTPWVCAGHAKRLERERDDALKEWDLARDGWGKALEERDEARRERDEARNIAKMAYTRLIGLGVSSHTPIQFMRDAIKAWDKEQKEEA